MAEPDRNQPKRDSILYKRVDYDPAKTNMALDYCDECGKRLHKGEKNRNRFLRDSTPLDFAGRGRSQRERLLKDRPKTLAAKCMMCWDRWKHQRDERRAKHIIRVHEAATIHEAGHRAISGEGVTIGAWVKGGGHEVEQISGLERKIIIRG